MNVTTACIFCRNLVGTTPKLCINNTHRYFTCRGCSNKQCVQCLRSPSTCSICTIRPAAYEMSCRKHMACPSCSQKHPQCSLCKPKGLPICSFCNKENSFKQLSCGHSFCRRCYKQECSLCHPQINNLNKCTGCKKSQFGFQSIFNCEHEYCEECLQQIMKKGISMCNSSSCRQGISAMKKAQIMRQQTKNKDLKSSINSNNSESKYSIVNQMSRSQLSPQISISQSSSNQYMPSSPLLNTEMKCSECKALIQGSLIESKCKYCWLTQRRH